MAERWTSNDMETDSDYLSSSEDDLAKECDCGDVPIYRFLSIDSLLTDFSYDHHKSSSANTREELEEVCIPEDLPPLSGHFGMEQSPLCRKNKASYDSDYNDQKTDDRKHRKRGDRRHVKKFKSNDNVLRKVKILNDGPKLSSKHKSTKRKNHFHYREKLERKRQFFRRRTEQKRYRHIVYDKLSRVEMQSIMLITKSNYDLRRSDNAKVARKSASVTACCPGIFRLHSGLALVRLLQSRFKIIRKNQEKNTRHVLKDPWQENDYLVRWSQYMKVPQLKPRGLKHLRNLTATEKDLVARRFCQRNPPAFLRDKLWYAINAKNINFSDMVNVTYSSKRDSESDTIAKNRLLRHVIQYMEILQTYPELSLPLKTLRRSERRSDNSISDLNDALWKSRETEGRVIRSALSNRKSVRREMRCSARYFLRRSHFSLRALLKDRDFMYISKRRKQKHKATKDSSSKLKQNKNDIKSAAGENTTQCSHTYNNISQKMATKRMARSPDRKHTVSYHKISSRCSKKRLKSVVKKSGETVARTGSSLFISCHGKGTPMESREFRRNESPVAEYRSSSASTSRDSFLSEFSWRFQREENKKVLAFENSEEKKTESLDFEKNRSRKRKESLSSTATIYKTPKHIEIPCDYRATHQSLYDSLSRQVLEESNSDDPRLVAAKQRMEKMYTNGKQETVRVSGFEGEGNIVECKNGESCQDIKSFVTDHNTEDLKYNNSFSLMDFESRKYNSDSKPKEVEDSKQKNEGSSPPIDKNDALRFPNFAETHEELIGDRETHDETTRLRFIEEQPEKIDLFPFVKCVPSVSSTVSSGIGLRRLLQPRITTLLTKQNTLDIIDDLCTLVRPISPLELNDEVRNCKWVAANETFGSGIPTPGKKALSFSPILSIDNSFQQSSSCSTRVIQTERNENTHLSKEVCVFSLAATNSLEYQMHGVTALQIIGAPQSEGILNTDTKNQQKNGNIRIVSFSHKPCIHDQNFKQEVSEHLYKKGDESNCFIPNNNLNSILSDKNLKKCQIKQYGGELSQCLKSKSLYDHSRLFSKNENLTKNESCLETLGNETLLQESSVGATDYCYVVEEAVSCKQGVRNVAPIRYKMGQHITKMIGEIGNKETKSIKIHFLSTPAQNSPPYKTDERVPRGANEDLFSHSLGSAFKTPLVSQPCMNIDNVSMNPNICYFLTAEENKNYMVEFSCSTADPKTTLHAHLNFSNNHGSESSERNKATSEPTPLRNLEDSFDTNPERDAATIISNLDYLCDNISTPIVLRASDRVYHVSNAPNVDQEATGMPFEHVLSTATSLHNQANLSSCTSSSVDISNSAYQKIHLDSKNLAEDLAAFNIDIQNESGRGQDLLSLAMQTAGLTDSEIESFLISDSAVESFLINECELPLEALLSSNKSDFTANQQNEARNIYESPPFFFNDSSNDENKLNLLHCISSNEGESSKAMNSRPASHIQLDTCPGTSMHTEDRIFSLKVPSFEETMGECEITRKQMKTCSNTSDSDVEVHDTNFLDIHNEILEAKTPICHFLDLPQNSDNQKPLNTNTNEIQEVHNHFEPLLEANLFEIQSYSANIIYKMNSTESHQREAQDRKFLPQCSTSLSWPSFESEFHDVRATILDGSGVDFCDHNKAGTQILKSNSVGKNDSKDISEIFDHNSLPDNLMRENPEESKDGNNDKGSGNNVRTTNKRLDNTTKLDLTELCQTDLVPSGTNFYLSSCSQDCHELIHPCIEKEALPYVYRSLPRRSGRHNITRPQDKRTSPPQAKAAFKARNIIQFDKMKSSSKNDRSEKKTDRNQLQLSTTKSSCARSNKEKFSKSTETRQQRKSHIEGKGIKSGSVKNCTSDIKSNNINKCKFSSRYSSRRKNRALTPEAKETEALSEAPKPETPYTRNPLHTSKSPQRILKKKKHQRASSKCNETNSSLAEKHIQNEMCAAELFTQQLLSSTPGFLKKVSPTVRDVLQPPLKVDKISTKFFSPLSISRRRLTKFSGLLPSKMLSQGEKNWPVNYRDSNNNNSDEYSEVLEIDKLLSTATFDEIAKLEKNINIYRESMIQTNHMQDQRLMSKKFANETDNDDKNSDCSVAAGGRRETRTVMCPKEQCLEQILREITCAEKGNDKSFCEKKKIPSNLRKKLYRIEQLPGNKARVILTKGEKDMLQHDEGFARKHVSSKKSKKKQCILMCFRADKGQDSKVNEKHIGKGRMSCNIMSKCYIMHLISNQSQRVNRKMSTHNRGRRRNNSNYFYYVNSMARNRNNCIHTCDITKSSSLIERNNSINHHDNSDCDGDKNNNNDTESDSIDQFEKEKTECKTNKAEKPMSTSLLKKNDDLWRQRGAVTQAAPCSEENMKDVHAARRKFKQINSKLARIHGMQSSGSGTRSTPTLMFSKLLAHDNHSMRSEDEALNRTIDFTQKQQSGIYGQKGETVFPSTSSKHHFRANGFDVTKGHTIGEGKHDFLKTRERESISLRSKSRVSVSTKGETGSPKIHEINTQNIVNLEKKGFKGFPTTRKIERVCTPSSFKGLRSGEGAFSRYSREFSGSARSKTNQEESDKAKNSLQRRKLSKCSSSTAARSMDAGLARFVERLNSDYGQQLAVNKPQSKGKLEQLCSRYLETFKTRKELEDKLMGGSGDSFNRDGVRKTKDKNARSHGIWQARERKKISLAEPRDFIMTSEKKRNHVSEEAEVPLWGKNKNENMKRSGLDGAQKQMNKRTVGDYGPRQCKATYVNKNKIPSVASGRQNPPVDTFARSLSETHPKFASTLLENAGERITPRAKSASELRPNLKESVERLSSHPNSPLARLQHDINMWESSFGKSFSLNMSKNKANAASRCPVSRPPKSSTTNRVPPSRTRHRSSVPEPVERLSRCKKLEVSRSNEETLSNLPNISNEVNRSVNGDVTGSVESRDKKINTFFGSLLDLINQKERGKKDKAEKCVTPEPEKQNPYKSPRLQAVDRAGSSKVGSMYRSMLDSVKSKRSSFMVDLDEHLKIPPLSDFEDMTESSEVLLSLPKLVSQPNVKNKMHTQDPVFKSVKEQCTSDQHTSNSESVKVSSRTHSTESELSSAIVEGENLHILSNSSLDIPPGEMNHLQRPLKHFPKSGTKRDEPLYSELEFTEAKETQIIKNENHLSHTSTQGNILFSELNKGQTFPQLSDDNTTRLRPTRVIATSPPKVASKLVVNTDTIVSGDFVNGHESGSTESRNRGGGGGDSGGGDYSCDIDGCDNDFRQDAPVKGNANGSEDTSLVAGLNLSLQQETYTKTQILIEKSPLYKDGAVESCISDVGVHSEASCSGETNLALHTSFEDESISWTSTGLDDFGKCDNQEQMPKNESQVLHDICQANDFTISNKTEMEGHDYSNGQCIYLNEKDKCVDNNKSRGQAQLSIQESDNAGIRRYNFGSAKVFSDEDKSPLYTDETYGAKFEHQSQITDASESNHNIISEIRDANCRETDGFACLHNQFEIKSLDMLEQQAEQDFKAVYKNSHSASKSRKASKFSHRSREIDRAECDQFTSIKSTQNQCSMRRGNDWSMDNLYSPESYKYSVSNISVVSHADEYCNNDHLYTQETFIGDSALSIGTYDLVNSYGLHSTGISHATESKTLDSFYNTENSVSRQPSDIPWDKLAATPVTRSYGQLPFSAFGSLRRSRGYSYLTPIEEESEEEQRSN
ncbi:hypothetical protein PoB_006001800 [Plakobranchus ocellatus]|uniref:Uncharacterized protein n=1 Tax=Plakobranchus ocellatus TaxID=259542 RepID=A0AAV4CNS5_9GAST|nr:hypothetical protein PoB_006001800 [Plakobranchus ocellatus]